MVYIQFSDELLILTIRITPEYKNFGVSTIPREVEALLAKVKAFDNKTKALNTTLPMGLILNLP